MDDTTSNADLYFSNATPANTYTPEYSYYSEYPGEMGGGPFYTIVFLVFIGIILVSVAGNSLVIFIVLRYRNMRISVTNFYIMNVALSDVVYTLFCMPITSYLFLSYYWIFGEFLCKFFSILQPATVQVTCTTLTVMTVDRYYVIISPLQSRQTRTIPRAAVISVAVWIFSFIVHIPSGVLYRIHIHEEHPYCSLPEGAGRGYLIFLFLSTYFIPLTIIGICYGLILSHLWKLSRNGSSKETSVQTATKKWKTTKIVLTVILLFALCWLPIHIFNIWESMQTDASNIHNSWLVACIHTFSLCLAYANSCINPFVYALAGTSFRKHIDRLSPWSAKRRGKAPNSTTKYSLQKNDTSRTEPTLMSHSTHL